MAIARLVSAKEVPVWNELARKRGELFQQPEWIDVFGASASRVGIFDGGDNLVGGFVVRLTRRAGIRIVRNAPFSQSAGPFWAERTTSAVGRLEERRKVMDAMAEFLEPGRGVAFVGLSSTAGDLLPFRWRGFKGAVEYTYRLHLSREGDEYLAVYDGKTRNDVRKARRDGLEASVGLNLEGIEELQRTALDRENAGGGASISTVLRYARTARESFTVSVHGKGVDLAACLVLGSGKKAYYVMGGHRRESGSGMHHGAGSLALHTAIVEAARRGYDIFDFEGSTIPRVEAFVRGFGGELTPYYTVAKGWFPLECAMKVRYRGYF